MKNPGIIAVAFALAGAIQPLGAQPPAKRVSPHETISTTLNGSQVKIEYGRPWESFATSASRVGSPRAAKTGAFAWRSDALR